MSRANTPWARRWRRFRANRRAMISLVLFGFLFLVSVFADVIANDRPLLVWSDKGLYLPILKDYPETEFGGFLPSPTDYRDPAVQALIKAQNGWTVWPLIPFSYDTIRYELSAPAPSAPDWTSPLGTDDTARDVLARAVHALRVSLFFGLSLALGATVLGVLLGALQGYFGGWTDLTAQRLTEVWMSIPELYVILIIAAIFAPSFLVLLIILLAFSWAGLAQAVRAEALRVRAQPYITAARALGLNDRQILLSHIMPNALVAAITYVPFVLNAAIATLTSLDFLGLGLPPGSASLGELLAQGKNNLDAPWLGLTAFFLIATVLSLTVFIGEGLRDAMDPRKA
ncbi:MAG TPA: ABC transporter permease [Alphaproteobacteria bacterium]|nr:ABC transporter permease [Alphaproteobacteria bacterium]HAJ45156.1 ABC transporter permease [Alphaproteobacteria bacterium]